MVQQYILLLKKFQKRKKNRIIRRICYFFEKLIRLKNIKKKRDNWVKIIILIFFASFFDFEEFIILNDILSKFENLSISLNLRIAVFASFVTYLLCVYALNFSFRKHEKCSITCIMIFLVIELVIEIIFSTEHIKILLIILLNILNLTLYPFTDVIERYLAENNFSNPYGILSGEGIFVFIMTTFYSLYNQTFEQIKQNHKDMDTKKLILLVFLLFLYMLLSAIINVYKVHCNIFWSPAGRTLFNYILNPIFLIYSFFYENDFIYKGKQNISFFILNEIISLLFTFSGFVYCEFIILSCFGLEHDTQYGIIKRANSSLDFSLDDIKCYDYNNDDNDIDYNNNII